MDCPDCGAPAVVFAVPADLRAYAPAAHAAICTRCLRVHPADAGAVDAADDPGFGAVADAFPDGRAGVAFALLCGKLDSLALHRREIQALVDEAERAGADVWLALDRLATADVAPHFDLDRRRTQLDDVA